MRGDAPLSWLAVRGIDANASAESSRRTAVRPLGKPVTLNGGRAEQRGIAIRDIPTVRCSFQPMVGSADAPHLYVAHGADLVGEPHADEAELVRWVPLDEAQQLIRQGEIVGAATVMAVLHAVAMRATAAPRTP